MYTLRDILLQEVVLKDVVNICLEKAKVNIDAIEVTVKQTKGISVSVRKGISEYIEFNNDGILCITVYKNNRKGSASSTDFSLFSIKKTLEAASIITNFTSEDFYSGLPVLHTLAIDNIVDLDLLHPVIHDINTAANLAISAENEAFAFDKRIFNTEGVIFNSHFSTIVCGNSVGLLQGYSSSIHSLSCCSVAKEKECMQRDYVSTISRKFTDLDSAKYIGQESASRSIARLFPRKINTIKSPVIFSSEVTPGFFYNFVNAINGYNVDKKSTFLLNKLGKNIFPSFLSIVDCPHIHQGLGSRPFDNEGVRTKNNLIVDKGRLISWLLDSYIARKLNLESTGHSGGIHNLLIQGISDLTFFNLLKYMGKGLLVTELMGDGVNIVTGNYSRGAFGFWIENGIVQYPVSEITISGNLELMFKNIIKIGNDINKNSVIKSGSILLSEMQISGL
ncbi:metalloprotease PmbA [Buchnera aphidicola]|uniref:metalloprotease PmbA n=1 Tax=Buchnera aphidicola TaxID=9 RepID=UPI003463DE76